MNFGLIFLGIANGVALKITFLKDLTTNVIVPVIKIYYFMLNMDLFNTKFDANHF